LPRSGPRFEPDLNNAGPVSYSHRSAVIGSTAKARSPGTRQLHRGCQVQRSIKPMNPGANTAEDRIRLYSGVRFRTLVCANGPACIFPPRVIVPVIRWRDGRCSGARRSGRNEFNRETCGNCDDNKASRGATPRGPQTSCRKSKKVFGVSSATLKLSLLPTNPNFLLPVTRAESGRCTGRPTVPHRVVG